MKEIKKKYIKIFLYKINKNYFKKELFNNSSR